MRDVYKYEFCRTVGRCDDGREGTAMCMACWEYGGYVNEVSGYLNINAFMCD